MASGRPPLDRRLRVRKTSRARREYFFVVLRPRPSSPTLPPLPHRSQPASNSRTLTALRALEPDDNVCPPNGFLPPHFCSQNETAHVPARPESHHAVGRIDRHRTRCRPFDIARHCTINALKRKAQGRQLTASIEHLLSQPKRSHYACLKLSLNMYASTVFEIVLLLSFRYGRTFAALTGHPSK
jgi:hypothetical protein